MFFAGTAAFLYAMKINDRGKLVRFLVTRGLILVILEVTLVRFFWTFNLIIILLLPVLSGCWMVHWTARVVYSPFDLVLSACLG